MSKVGVYDTNIIIFGPPGSGKGTQSSRIARDRQMVHLSTGDMIRRAIQNKTEQGLAVKSFMDKGQLVPDELINKMFSQELNRHQGKGVILDGYPRTVAQAQTLDKILREKGSSIGKVLFLDVPETALLERLSGRRVCDECGAVFNIGLTPPKKEGQCDLCQGVLIQRNDDTEEVIKDRLSVYKESTLPVKQYYKDGNKLCEVNAYQSPDEVFQSIIKVIDSASGDKLRELRC